MYHILLCILLYIIISYPSTAPLYPIILVHFILSYWSILSYLLSYWSILSYRITGPSYPILPVHLILVLRSIVSYPRLSYRFHRIHRKNSVARVCLRRRKNSVARVCLSSSSSSYRRRSHVRHKGKEIGNTISMPFSYSVFA
jgi:hypothetical protein